MTVKRKTLPGNMSSVWRIPEEFFCFRILIFGLSDPVYLIQETFPLSSNVTSKASPDCFIWGCASTSGSNAFDT